MARDNNSHFTNSDRVLITKLDVKVERLINDVAELRNNFATKEELSTISQEVDAIKNTNTWIVRLIIGAIILAVLGLVLVRTIP
jgi:outer membrane murein-binding lipoprotein Lpp